LNRSQRGRGSVVVDVVVVVVTLVDVVVVVVMLVVVEGTRVDVDSNSHLVPPRHCPLGPFAGKHSSANAHGISYVQ